ncbi:MAG: hypothetical protein ACTSYF_03485 [Promethearchaeota archaeon]
MEYIKEGGANNQHPRGYFSQGFYIEPGDPVVNVECENIGHRQ